VVFCNDEKRKKPGERVGRPCTSLATAPQIAARSERIILPCLAADLGDEYWVPRSQNEVEAWWKATHKGRKYKSSRQSLWDGLKTARYIGRISEEEWKDADKVRTDGNEAVHQRPSSFDPLDSIQKTVRVLDALAR
jgi:hypothetical protein